MPPSGGVAGGISAPTASRVVYDFAADRSDPSRNGAAVKLFWRDGDLRLPLPPELVGRQPWPFPPIGGQLWIGDDGKLVAGIYGENPTVLDAERQRELTESPPPERYPRSEGVYAEWLAACRGGDPAGSSFAGHAGPLTEMVLLGNLAVRLAQPIEIDPATGAIRSPSVPAELLRPTLRSGWSM